MTDFIHELKDLHNKLYTYTYIYMIIYIYNVATI